MKSHRSRTGLAAFGFGLALAMLIAAVGLTACSRSSSNSAPADRSNVVVTGTAVTEASEPLPSAQVFVLVEPGSGAMADTHVGDQNVRPILAETTTDDEGNFEATTDDLSAIGLMAGADETVTLNIQVVSDGLIGSTRVDRSVAVDSTLRFTDAPPTVSVTVAPKN